MSWDRHTDSDVFEYVIQRTESLDSSFLDIAISTTDTFYIDSFPNAGMNYYMVRGVKPIENCSGMHYELSHGLIDSVEFREPVAYAGNDTVVCESSDVVLGTSLAYDTFVALNWSPGTLLSDSTAQQPTWTVAQSQDFIINAMDTITGCVDMDTISITSNPLPLDTINQPLAFNGCGDTISVSASHSPTGKSYHWTFESGSPAIAGGVGSHMVSWTVASSYTIYLSVYNQTTLCMKQDSYVHYVACVLPVQLLRAEANYQSNCKDLKAQWTTSAEYNLRGYYLELYNGQNLIRRIFVPAKSNNLNLVNTYEFTTQVEQEVNRFKLVELDNNNTTTVLTHQAVSAQNCLNEIEIFPNPMQLSTQPVLTLRNIRGIEQVLLYDASGTQILQKELNAQAEAVIKLDNQLTAGLYYVVLGEKRIKLIVY